MYCKHTLKIWCAVYEQLSWRYNNNKKIKIICSFQHTSETVEHRSLLLRSYTNSPIFSRWFKIIFGLLSSLTSYWAFMKILCKVKVSRNCASLRQCALTFKNSLNILDLNLAHDTVPSSVLSRRSFLQISSTVHTNLVQIFVLFILLQMTFLYFWLAFQLLISVDLRNKY